MKKCFVLAIIISILSLGIFAGELDSKSSKKAIRVAPPSPKFSDTERQAELAMRRQKVVDAMADNSMLILLSAEPKIYTNDVDFFYRQENNLYYLTALKQGGITLIITKNGDDVRETLFVPERDPLREHWEGRMYSKEDATRISGIKNIVKAGFAKEVLNALKSKRSYNSTDENFSFSEIPETIYLIQSNQREFGAEKKLAEELSGFDIRNAYPIFAELRLIKSPYEIKILQHAIDITGEGLMRSMGVVGRASYEYEVHAEMDYTFRRRNADYWGFPSIVGCGPNATTLHYTESQGEVRKGDLILMDVGAEYDHYTADVTRTFPVNGKFTKEQAEIYQIVFDAQEAAARELKPGSTIAAASNAARQTVIEGLFKLGLIPDKTSGFDQVWFTHGWGHWLGMNVHDVGNYGTILKPGMVTTNEPGIYIRENALDNLPDNEKFREFKKKVMPAFEKYKNIGVRIEDDMLISKDGVEWMSRDIPRKIEEIESFMKLASEEMKNYALIKKPENSIFAVREFGANNFGFYNQNSFLQGYTLKSGWMKTPNTIEIHSH